MTREIPDLDEQHQHSLVFFVLTIQILFSYPAELELLDCGDHLRTLLNYSELHWLD